MAPLPVTSSDLDDHVCCLKPFYRNISPEILHALLESRPLVISTIVSKQRTSEASHIHCMYGNISKTVKDSHCYYRPLIGSDIWPPCPRSYLAYATLISTFYYYYYYYRIEASPITLSHLLKVISYCKPFKYDSSCSIWQDFDWHSASHCPSTIAEFFCTVKKLICDAYHQQNSKRWMPCRILAMVNWL